MRKAKSAFGLIGACLPVLYCGGLVYYFVNASGSPQQAARDGLGPTVVGLGAIGLLFCIPLIVKIVRMSSGPRSPDSSGEGGFDADAVIARHLARRSAEIAAGPPSAPVASQGVRPAKPSSFGRKSS